MNKKGFTLIELLSIIIILSVIMTIAVVSISDNINKSKEDSFVNLAKNYAESARSLRANGKLLYEPKNGEAIIIPYDQLNDLDITNSSSTGYGKILPSYCFVGIMNKNNNYLYYVNQVDESYHILDGIEYNSMTNNDIESSEEILSTLAQIRSPLTSFNIDYGDSNYQIKGVRVEFYAKYKQESNTSITSFDLTDRNTTFKGKLYLYNMESNDSSKRIELKVENSKSIFLHNKLYTFKDIPNDNTTDMVAVDSFGQALKINNKKLKINIKAVTENSVSFDLLADNEIIYENVNTTADTILSGYYTIDNSYQSSNAMIKGSISSYDNYVNSNVNNIEYTINGIKYLLNGSTIKYIIVKK